MVSANRISLPSSGCEVYVPMRRVLSQLLATASKPSSLLWGVATLFLALNSTKGINTALSGDRFSASKWQEGANAVERNLGLTEELNTRCPALQSTTLHGRACHEAGCCGYCGNSGRSNCMVDPLKSYCL